MLLTYSDPGPELTLNTFLPMKDPSKPDGEAVNADGSLKDANQIQWVNSPSEEFHLPIPSPNEEDMGDVAETGEKQELKKSHVSYYEKLQTSKTHLSQPFERRKSISSGSDHESEFSDMYMDQDVDDKVLDDKDDEKDKMDVSEEEGNDADENEDVDEEVEKAEKRYWEAKTKEGVHKVCLVIA